MSSDHPFDLKRDDAPAENDQPKLDWSDSEEPGGDAAGPLLRRARHRTTGSTLKATRKAEAPVPEAKARGRMARLFGWLVSPTFYYGLGLVSVAALLLSLFNPSFGAVARAWPHELLGIGGQAIQWHEGTIIVIALLAALLSYAIALIKRPGPGRGLLVVLGTAVPWIAFQQESEWLGQFTLPLLTALMAGALLAGGPGGAPRRRWQPLLLVGLFLLGGQLFLPWTPEHISQEGVIGDYVCTAGFTADQYVNPPWDFPEVTDEGAAAGYGQLIEEHLVASLAVLMLGLGLLAFLGLGRRWARWATGLILVVLFVGVAHGLYRAGLSDSTLSQLDSWQQGATGWARSWYLHALAYALPFAAAVAELVRGRQA